MRGGSGVGGKRGEGSGGGGEGRWKMGGDGGEGRGEGTAAYVPDVLNAMCMELGAVAR